MSALTDLTEAFDRTVKRNLKEQENNNMYVVTFTQYNGKIEKHFYHHFYAALHKVCKMDTTIHEKVTLEILK